MSNVIHTINIDPLRVIVRFGISENLLHTARELNIKLPSLDYLDGRAGLVGSNNDAPNEVLCFFLKGCTSVGDIAHESVHVVDHIMKMTGIERSENFELEAYLIGYVAEKIHFKLHS